MILAVGTIVLGLCGSVLGHGNIVWPPVWQDANGSWGLKSGHQCSAGAEVEGLGFVATCNWWTDKTYIPGDPTIPDYMLTWPDKAGGPDMDWDHMPWKAPGSAPVESPCGVPGGVKEVLNSTDGSGLILGAHKVNFKDVVTTTQWKIGSRVEAFWGLFGNHGGGYSYRLCKVPPEGNSGLTEECFQKTPLPFSGNQQWVQYGEDESTRVYFAANRTDIGTSPKGSQWTKIPVPACDAWLGGVFDKDDLCVNGTQFEPPAPDIFGFGSRAWSLVDSKLQISPTFNFTIGDNLEVPDDLEPGEYVIGFRWDCEQLPQVYGSCSTVQLVK